MNKPKLFSQVRSTHLMDSFRVDLHEDGEFFSRMNESVGFRMLNVTEDYIDVEILHVVYTGGKTL